MDHRVLDKTTTKQPHRSNLFEVEKQVYLYSNVDRELAVHRMIQIEIHLRFVLNRFHSNINYPSNLMSRTLVIDGMAMKKNLLRTFYSIYKARAQNFIADAE